MAENELSGWASRGRVVMDEGVLEDAVVVVEGDTIALVAPCEEARASAWSTLVVDLAPTDDVLVPGLIDLHCHGGGGSSFPDSPDVATAAVAAREHLRAGTTSLVASLVTASRETLLERTAVLADLADAGEIAGIHLEGPFLSADRCGAQDPTLMQVPDPDLVREVARVARGHLVTMTVAPEVPGVAGPAGVADALAEVGALPSFGHTDAAAGEMRAALEESFVRLGADGVRSRRPTVTHLFNGMRPLAHREAGPVPDCLAAAARGRAVVELVADGTHVHPALVRDVFDMVGAGNVALVTDAMAAAGMPDGAYRLGSQDVTVVDGVARLTHGGSIAGGTAHLAEVLRVTVEGGVPLVDAVRAVTSTPAAVLGRSDLGRLAAGARADVLVLGPDLSVRRVARAGAWVA
ncbi:N-acetylglucosamine 6-phosphate deacetylase [Flavimobilis soli]|uniref:N-acetylglucosamine 6-phosphate deacetylase n=1 Tax=Flavimobilis soli TaxID=442709 RepID=A0A2A9EGE7_9MICO|nr:amidohydrolase family protein [Flavimobilis soli]PFG37696.1 N-acetylglucosamine 6-phosphate deacetylase [Flavimobilis soli]